MSSAPLRSGGFHLHREKSVRSEEPSQDRSARAGREDDSAGEVQCAPPPVGNERRRIAAEPNLALASRDRQRIEPAVQGGHGRVVGTVAAIGVVISVLAIIYMATRPHVQPKDNSNLHLLPPPGAQVTDK